MFVLALGASISKLLVSLFRLEVDEVPWPIVFLFSLAKFALAFVFIVLMLIELVMIDRLVLFKGLFDAVFVRLFEGLLLLLLDVFVLLAFVSVLNLLFCVEFVATVVFGSDCSF